MTEPKRRVLVGAGNGGLGSALIDRLLADGRYDVFATYRSTPRGLDEKFAAAGVDPAVHVVHADLTEIADVTAAVDRAAQGGPLWGIINLAGLSSAQRLSKMSADDIRNVLLANSLPSLLLTKVGLAAFSTNGLGGGRLIHLSSVTVRRPVPGVIAYVAGKAAVEGMARAAAEEAGRCGSTVNVLRLGYFEAGMTTGVPAPILEGVIASTPAKRLGAVDELAAAVLFLLGEGSAFVNGSVIDIDGGLT